MKRGVVDALHRTIAATARSIRHPRGPDAVRQRQTRPHAGWRELRLGRNELS